MSREGRSRRGKKVDYSELAGLNGDDAAPAADDGSEAEIEEPSDDDFDKNDFELEDDGVRKPRKKGTAKRTPAKTKAAAPPKATPPAAVKAAAKKPRKRKAETPAAGASQPKAPKPAVAGPTSPAASPPLQEPEAAESAASGSAKAASKGAAVSKAPKLPRPKARAAPKGATGSKSAAKAAKKSEEAPVKTVGEASRVLRAYMREQNRPQSATTVHTNLHGRVAKPLVTKVLADLSAPQETNPEGVSDLVEKVYGKAKVYYANQTLFDAASLAPEHLSALATEVERLDSQRMEQQARLREAQRRLAALMVELTDDALDAAIAEASASNAQRCQRIAALGQTEPVSPGRAEKLRTRQATVAKVLKQRRGAALRALEMIAEQMSSTAQKAADLLGLELDE